MSREQHSNQSICSICLEPATGDIRQLGCNHRFHTACYNDWARRCSGNVTCPNCRASSTDEHGRQCGRRSVFNDNWRASIPSYHSRFENAFHNPDMARDVTPAELVVMVILLTIAVVIVSVFTSVSSTCMCRLNWSPSVAITLSAFLLLSSIAW